MEGDEILNSHHKIALTK